MKKKSFSQFVAAVGVTAMVAGCAAPTPESCLVSPNQTLGGALIGAGLGTAIGAAASRGSGGGMLAGAAIGMLVGAAIGQQQDQACFQLAMRTAFEQAEAERRAYEADVAQAAMAHAARSQAAAARAAEEQSRPVVQYKPVAWRSKSTGNGGTITPTNNFTDQATGRNCWSFEDRPITSDGASGPPVTRRACMGADGNVVSAN